MRQVLVDSRDRISTSPSATDFSINLPQTLTLVRGQRVRVDNWRIPLTIPTVRAGFNDQLVVTMGSGNYTMTVPQANYDGQGFAAMLQSLLQNTVPGTWSVVYDGANVSLGFSCSNPFTINYGTLTKRWFTYPYTKSADSKSWKFSYVSVLGVDVLYLCCPQLSNLDNVGPNGSSDVLLAANVTCPFGAVLDASMPWDTWLDVPDMTTQHLTFQVRDRYNNILPLPDISFTLTID